MPEFQPNSPEQHFAQQRTRIAAEIVNAALDAQRKNDEDTRTANERFYNGLALYSGGTIALSVTFMGYLKTLGKPLGHPYWLKASWTCLLVCAGCSSFWVFVYGQYSYFFHVRQAADAQRSKFEIDAEALPTMTHGAKTLQTRAPTTPEEIKTFQSDRLRAAAIYKERAAKAQESETSYFRFWRWMGRVARICFVIGLAFLLVFAFGNL